jgi:predicted amidophosphoribosyltransferase
VKFRSAPNTFAPNIIFGVPLEHVKKENNVPIPVEHCVRYLEQRGLNEEGLLRVAGNTTEIKKLKAEYDSGSTQFQLKIREDFANLTNKFFISFFN